MKEISTENTSRTINGESMGLISIAYCLITQTVWLLDFPLYCEERVSQAQLMAGRCVANIFVHFMLDTL
jgi:hypothetical protein